MKNILIFLTLFCVTLFGSIGQISVLKGNAKIDRAGSFIEVISGMEVENKDVIVSNKGSRLQVVFEDKTVITIGSNSTFKIEDYIYNKNSNEVKADFGFSKGAFKAITGQIGKINPGKFKIKAKTATIGIRGTRLFVKVDDEQETIACTQGEISVFSNGISVNLLAGEITTVLKNQIPQAPRDIENDDLNNFENSFGVNPLLAKKIESIKLGKDLSFDGEAVGKIIDEISSIQDGDAKAAALHLLEDSLNTQLDSLAENYANRVELASPKANFSGYTPLQWGFYTTNKPSDNSLDSIIQAIPDDLWSKSINDDKTLPQKISSYINTNTLVSYKGKSIGYITDANSYTAILDNDNNIVDLTFDFGNRAVSGVISFDSKDISSEQVKNWKVYVGSFGESVVNTTGFDVVNFLDSQDGSVVSLDYAKVFLNRFYGEDAYQTNGYFKFFSKDNKEAYGMFIGSQEQKIEKIKTSVESTTTYDWGYWTLKESVSLSNEDLKNALVYGAWINSKDELTSIEYLKTIQNASYEGELLGSVNHLQGGDISIIKNSKINLNFDFSTASMNGDLSFEANSKKWGVDIKNGVISDSSFKASAFANKSGVDVNTLHQELKGNFYGKEAGLAAGSFSFTGNNGDLALGAFKGIKK